MSSPSGPDAGFFAGAGFRRLILALIALGAVGLIGELLLLEHFEDPWQFAPLASLGLTLLTAGVVAVRPSRAALRAFQVVMVSCVVFGAIGVFLHFRGNGEFELESDPTLKGLAYAWAALRGGAPILAPGALAQLGLLGLLFSYRHPAGVAPATSPNHDQERQ